MFPLFARSRTVSFSPPALVLKQTMVLGFRCSECSSTALALADRGGHHIWRFIYLFCALCLWLLHVLHPFCQACNCLVEGGISRIRFCAQQCTRKEKERDKTLNRIEREQTHQRHISKTRKWADYNRKR